MTRYYKLKRFPGWYYKVVGKNAWCIRYPPEAWTVNDDSALADNPISVDILIKDYELIELTKEQLFLELL